MHCCHASEHTCLHKPGVHFVILRCLVSFLQILPVAAIAMYGAVGQIHAYTLKAVEYMRESHATATT